MRVLHAENENERFVRLSRGWCVWFFSEFIEDHAKPPTWTFGLHTMPRHQICSIPGCSSRSDSQEFEGVKFHCTPQDPDLKPEWLVNIRNPVCMKTPGFAAYTLKEVKKSADSPLPSIFPCSVSVKHRQPPAIRNRPYLWRRKAREVSNSNWSDTASRETERHEERIVQLQANI